MSLFSQDYQAIMQEIAAVTLQINDLKKAAVPTASEDISRSLATPNYVGTITTGDTAWMLVSCALVLFMTMPGLAIYYAGMLQTKNMLAMAMQIFSITCLITVLWLCFGYSLAFSPSGYFPESPQTIEDTVIYGNSQRFWLQGMTLSTVHSLATGIPEAVFCMFQLTFAIITPALICGSIADRMKYFPMLVFIGLWHLCVYCPIAHSNWHPNGLLFKYGTLDYAGGNVVHISSGVSALVAALVVGNRTGWKPSEETHPPHNILLTFMGMSMLWVGWFGFNAGSAVGANPRAAYAMLATMIATGTASLSWMLTETAFRKKPSVLGMISGAIAGLVTITPGCGLYDMNGAFFAGLIGGCFCYFGAHLKYWVFGIDDALDAFGVHAIGGIIGGILVGFLICPEVTGIDGIVTGNAADGADQLTKQMAGIAFAIGWSGIGSFIILKGVDMTMGLRVTKEEEEMGLDKSIHGESIGTEDVGADGNPPAKVVYENNPSIPESV